MKKLFYIIVIFVILFTANSQNNSTEENFSHFKIENINVRFSAGYQYRLNEVLANKQSELDAEQAKLDEAKSRRKSVSRAMQKMIVKIRELTKERDFILSEMADVPSEVKQATEKALSKKTQGNQEVTLNIQIASFIAAKKRQEMWPSIHNIMAGTINVIDNKTDKILASYSISDIDLSNYSANTAAFIQGAAIGAAGMVGFMFHGLLSSHGGRTDLIEDFTTRTVEAIYPSD